MKVVVGWLFGRTLLFQDVLRMREENGMLMTGFSKALHGYGDAHYSLKIWWYTVEHRYFFHLL